ncbi:MAG: glycosyltransferase [Actinobacteria bacterium]|nr:glycosyltransferase [Actinomycetota bacterium]
MDEELRDARLTILIAARDEQERIGATIGGLRRLFPGVEVIVADDGSRDSTAHVATEAGARVLRLPHRGKGQALTLAEREAAPGRLLLCDADLRGDLSPLVEADGDVVVAAFARKQGGGFGLAKGTARRLIELATGVAPREPLSGQRVLSADARDACFPVAAGFAVETRMTSDALRAGLEIREVDLELEHRSTVRDLAGFVHRGRQLRDIVFAFGPQGTNHRGLRLPLVGWVVGLTEPRVAPIALLGLADDLWSGEERGFRAHLRKGRTTGVLKLAGIPLYALLRTRSLSGALLVALCANAVNQLDTRPGRALKAFALGSLALSGTSRRGVAVAVLLAPYDLREMAMLGDSGSNALGAVLGFNSVERFSRRQRWSAVAALAGLTLLGEKRSLGTLIEQTSPLRELDALGRQAS